MRSLTCFDAGTARVEADIVNFHVRPEELRGMLIQGAVVGIRVAVEGRRVVLVLCIRIRIRARAHVHELAGRAVASEHLMEEAYGQFPVLREANEGETSADALLGLVHHVIRDSHWLSAAE